MTNQIYFKTCRKMLLNAPRDCLVSVSVPLYHQPVRNTTLSLQFFMHVCVCVCVYFAAEASSTGTKQSWVLLIQEVTRGIEYELAANSQLVSQTGIPQAWFAQHDYPKVSWRDALLHHSTLALRSLLPKQKLT